MSDTPRTDAAKNRRGIEGDAWIRADFARELERELNAANSERDEARRWVCELWEKYQPATSSMTARDYAAECGWDCFKEVKP